MHRTLVGLTGRSRILPVNRGRGALASAGIAERVTVRTTCRGNRGGGRNNDHIATPNRNDQSLAPVPECVRRSAHLFGQYI